ncbi:MAG: tetratricopeptide repeat protein [bacterium]
MARQLLLISCFILQTSNLVFAGDLQNRLGLGFSVNSQKLYGDTNSGKFLFGVNPGIVRYDLGSTLFLESQLGIAKLSSEAGAQTLNTNLIELGFKVGHRFFSTQVITPLFYLGGGIFNFRINDRARAWDAFGAAGAGLEVFLRDNMGLNLSGEFRYTSGDDFDGGNSSPRNDSILNMSVGFVFYMGSRKRYVEEPMLTESIIEEYPDEDEEPDEDSDSDLAAETAIDSSYLAGLLEAKNERQEAILLYKSKLRWLEQQVVALEGRLQKATTGAPSLTPAPPDSSRLRLNRKFTSGLLAYKNKNYLVAVNTFVDLLQASPDAALASRCWYWLGECYFSERDYTAAEAAYEQVLQSPESSKREAAVLMVGICRLKAGKLAQAKEALEELLRTYPGSPFVAISKHYLAKLSS